MASMLMKLRLSKWSVIEADLSCDSEAYQILRHGEEIFFYNFSKYNSFKINLSAHVQK
jgi:hypothetical protein